MLMPTIILKGPSTSQMSLSTQVKESVALATNHLRDALAFAARSEHPICITTISELLMRVESIEQMDEIMQKFGGTNKSSGPTPH